VERPQGAKARVTTRFDALKLAADSASLAGEVEVRRMPRLADRVRADAGGGEARIRWNIAGGKDAKGHPLLTLELDGEVQLTCQRCLGPLAMPIDQRTVLLVARDESELVRLDAEEPEVVLATAPLDALQLVEDEMLLSLPFSPRHVDGACATTIAPENVGSKGPRGPDPAFAQLAGMKTRQRSRA
jgi:uncharacterized protein